MNQNGMANRLIKLTGLEVHRRTFREVNGQAMQSTRGVVEREFHTHSI